jgi:hypothetical protein
MNTNLPDNILEIVQKKQNTLQTTKTDMSFGEIANIYIDKALTIRPEYQRLFRWTPSQKTRFIESVILGIPIPSIFVAEDENGDWELIDGLQRISTVISFMGKMRQENIFSYSLKSNEDDESSDEININYKNENNWKLEECSLIEVLNGKTFDELPHKLQNNIKRSPCRIEILKSNSQDLAMKYELFDRLNTGGSKATPQEVRNCIFRGFPESKEFYELIEKLPQEKDFTELTNLPNNKKNELYDQELVLRFFTLYNSNDDFEATDNLAKIMTSFMKTIVIGAKEKWGNEKKELTFQEFDLIKQKELFLRTINVINKMNKRLSRSLVKGNNSNFSSNLYDVVMLGIAFHIDSWEQGIAKKTIDFNDLENKVNNIRGTLSGGSGNSSAIKKRIQKAKELFTLNN